MRVPAHSRGHWFDPCRAHEAVSAGRSPHPGPRPGPLRWLGPSGWLARLVLIALLLGACGGPSPGSTGSTPRASAAAPGKGTAAGATETVIVTGPQGTAAVRGAVSDLIAQSATELLAAVRPPLVGGSDLDGSLASEGIGGVARSSDGGTTWSWAWDSPGAAMQWVGKAGPDLVALGQTYPVVPSVSTTSGGELTLVTSADGGASWSAAPVQAPPAVAGLWGELQFGFLTSQVGFGVQDPDVTWDDQAGFSGVLRTSDGGRAWSLIPLPGGAQATGGVAFSGSRAFLTVSTGTGDGIMVSSDGGLSWSLVPGSVHSFGLWSLSFADGQHGFAAGGGYEKYSLEPDRVVLATADGGLSWQARYEANDPPSASTNGFARVDFLSPLVGAAAVGGCTSGQNAPCDGEVYVTGDGGRSWKGTGPRALSLAAFGPTDLWAQAGMTGTLERSSDAGASWTAAPGVPAASGGPALSLTGGPGALLLQAGGGFSLSTDAGQSWAPFNPPIVSGTAGSGIPPAVEPPDVVVFSFGRPPVTRVSQDNGSTWESVPDGSLLVPSELVLGEGRAYAVSAAPPLPGQRAGAVFGLQIAGGAKAPAWRVVGNPGVVEDIVGASGKTVVALGYPPSTATPFNGLFPSPGTPLSLRVSTDGGTSWQPAILPTTASCLGLPTVAGSSIWVPCPPPTGATLTTPYAVAVSPDLGRTWRVYELPGVAILSVVAVAPTEAWAVAADGRLLHTTDSGQSWVGSIPALPGG
jgi:photosystem II stability/assembly factor-like uncharacterized protein